jgi:hypothetical protein
MAAVLSLLIVATLSLLVMRIAAMALMLTGLSSETARFQARSAFTGTGFTTSESEKTINHPVRRRIIMLLMLLGNVGIATVMATIVLSVMNVAGSGGWLISGLFLAGGIALLIALATSRRIEVMMNRLIAKCLKRWTHLNVTDYVAVLQLHKGYAVSEMRVEERDWLAGKTLIEAALAKEGVLVLGIERADGSYIGTPGANDVIAPGDNLVLYSTIQRIEELDRRSAGHEGECAHCRAIVEHQHDLELQESSGNPPEDKKRRESLPSLE